MYFYSLVQYCPAAEAGERVVLGLIVGNDTDGWAASWWPERASLIGAPEGKDTLDRWINTVCTNMNLATLCKEHEDRMGKLSLTRPRYMYCDSLEDAQKRVLHRLPWVS